MKKRLLSAGFLLVATLLSTTGFAQNFQPFRQGLTYHYISQDSIFSLRVDSAKVVAGDSVFVFNQTVKKVMGNITGPGCTTPGGAYQIRNNNQFGKQVTKKANGDYLFQTSQGQNFLLKTKVAVGQNWTFHAGQNITATLMAKVVEPVASISDSVFTYSLSNGAQIRLSKNYGFVSAPNFAAYADASFKPKTLQFYALPEKGIGQAISDPFRIYDFTSGDKFAYYKETFTPLWTGPCTKEWTTKEVTNRRLSTNGDSVYYTFRVERAKEAFGSASAPSGMCQAPAGITVFPPYTETMIVIRNSPAIVLALSNGFYVNTGNLYSSMVSEGISKKAQYNYREQLHAATFQFHACSNSFNHRIDNGHAIKYGVGIGKTFEGTMYSTETLTAYVKGTETFGRWQSIAQTLGTKEDLTKPLVKAFPNPFTSEITLSFGETSGQIKLALLNTLGQKVWEQETTATANAELNVNLPALAKGFYILQASQDGKIYTSRLVKE